MELDSAVDAPGEEAEAATGTAEVFAARELPVVVTHLTVWAGVLGVGALLLAGRYDLSAAAMPHARSSYLSSVFFFVPTLVSAHYLLRLSPLRRGAVYALSALLFVLLTLPYHWLGMTPLRRHACALWTTEGAAPAFTFLPDRFPVESFPNERLFFVALLLSLALSATALTSFVSPRARSLRGALRRSRFWISAYALILVGAWLHTGLRSGYTFTAYLAFKPEKQNYYMMYLFPETRQGAINADHSSFHDLDYYFQGVLPTPNTLLLHRSYFHYLGSQLSGFFNPYYVYLALNTLAWFAAAACLYGVTARVLRRTLPAQFAAMLVCVGNGFYYFVAQPKFYLAGYAVAAMALYAFEVLSGPTTVARWHRTALLGVLLGLASLVYDVQPSLVGLILYAIFRRRSVLQTVVALAMAAAMSALWGWLQHGYLRLPVNRANSSLAAETLQNIGLLLAQPHKGKLYWLCVRALSSFTQNLSYAFMGWAFVLGLFGLAVARRARDRWLPIVLLCPALMVNVLLTFGQLQWHSWSVVEFARFSYVAYPAVYVSAALALERIVGPIVGPGPRWRWWLARTCVAALGLWQSADAFGFVSPAYHFYFPELNSWLEEY